MRRAFTLIELLVVVGIIAILAAIAVPNFLEAQTRAKVSRVKADFRALSTAFESYHIDHNNYPYCWLDCPPCDEYVLDDKITDLIGFIYSAGFMSQATHETRFFRGAPPKISIAGRDFDTVTTPIAYITKFPTDLFITEGGGKVITYGAMTHHSPDAYLFTSVGPDTDFFSGAVQVGPDAHKLVRQAGMGTNPPIWGVGTLNDINPMGTLYNFPMFSPYPILNPPAVGGIGEIQEEPVYWYLSGLIVWPHQTIPRVEAIGGLKACLETLAYDPTNGTTSDGDLYHFRMEQVDELELKSE